MSIQKEKSGRRIFVLHIEGMFWCNECSLAVEQIRRMGFGVRICSDAQSCVNVLTFGVTQPEGCNSYDVDNAREMLQDIGHILIPFMPLHLFEKIADLDDSDPIAEMILFSLCMGKKVGILTKGPEMFIPASTGCETGLSQSIGGRFAAAKKIGIEFIEPDRLEAWICGKTYHKMDRKRIITYEDVMEAVEKCGAIHISDGDVITPLARDLIKERKIAIGGEQVCK